VADGRQKGNEILAGFACEKTCPLFVRMRTKRVLRAATAKCGVDLATAISPLYRKSAAKVTFIG
jgi:hypothetical protein